MKPINMKHTVRGPMARVLERVTADLQREGFGVLTRIDLHDKFREKLGKEVAPAIILGACNPKLAYEAYQANPDVASLLPCNVVLREVGPERISVEIARPSAMMAFLGDPGLAALAEDGDRRLARVLESLASSGERGSDK